MKKVTGRSGLFARGLGTGVVALVAVLVGAGLIAVTFAFPDRVDRNGAVATSIVGTLLVAGAVLTAVRAYLTQRHADAAEDDLDRDLALGKIDGYRATFDECIRRGEASQPAAITRKQPFIDEVHAGFDQIKARVAASNDEDEIDLLCDSAEELERLRAYVIPKPEIVVDGKTKLADMYEWGVPTAVLDKLTVEAVPMLSSSDEEVARAALRQIYENYDYWDWYVEDHATKMRAAGGVLLGLMLVSLTGAVLLLHVRHVYSGVFCAGLAGALLSVVAKLPPVMSYGAANAYVSQIMSRVGVGVAASLIGIGLLASDVISIRLPGDVSFAQMLNGEDVDGKIEPDAPPVAGEATVEHFSKRAVLLIVAVSMLFGFSERALATFEDKVLPTRVVVSPNASPKGDSSSDDPDEET